MEDCMTRSLLAAVLFARRCTGHCPTGPPPPSEPPCLRQRNIYDFKTVPGNRSLIVTDLARKRYRLNFMGVCYDLQYQLGLAFRTRGVGTCPVSNEAIPCFSAMWSAHSQCIIQSVEYQTPALDRADIEAAAAAKAKRQ